MGDLAEFGANAIGAYARNKVRTHHFLFIVLFKDQSIADRFDLSVEQRENQSRSRRAKVSCERQGEGR